jgi:eukaryotic-like serine/threonine-protein kinase
VAFGGHEEGREPRIFVQDLSGGLPRRISPEGVRTIGLATPDSQFVLGSSGGRHILFPVKGGESRALPFLAADDSPVQWTSDGQSLFVVRGASSLDAESHLYQTMEAQIDKVHIPSGRRSAWKTLKPIDPIGLESIDSVYISPDGSSYCYGYERTLSDLFMIEGIK